MDWPTLAVVIGGPAVGIAGVVVPYFNGKEQRVHERALAREERLHDELRSSYAALIEFPYLINEVLRRTYPLLGPLPALPPRPPEEDARRLFARVAVVASEDVTAAMTETATITQEFWGYVRTLGWAVGIIPQRLAYLDTSGDEVLPCR